MCSIFAARTFHIKMQMKADMSEEELSLQCQRGDMRARHTLYERYGGLLMAICLRYFNLSSSFLIKVKALSKLGFRG